MLQIRKIFTSLTFNSVFLLVLGLLIAAAAGFVGYKWRMYPFAAGLFFLGIGSVLCGLTNGFTDQSPNGRRIRQFGVMILAAGLVLTFYYISKFM